MQPLAVFISSTCFDLRSLREHLRAEIAGWGHEPILSEYPSFPVSPDLSTVENCKKVVKARADVLVLIIGGRRGSLDPTTSNSVVNSEYREARAKGLDCIVFADKAVWDLLPMYRRNPNMDFTPTVDSPAVLRFLEEVCGDTRWVFPFTKTEEILTTLRVQLSTRFQDLLSRHREGRLQVPTAFAAEPDHIARIAADRDELWEFRLASELLRDRIGRLTTRFSDLDRGFAVRRTKFLRAQDTMGYVQDLLHDYSLIVQSASKILSEQLTPAFGPPGVPGVAEEIRAACDNLYSLFLSLYEWELDVRFVRVHDALADILPLMSGWTNDLLNEFRRIPQELDRLLADPNLRGQHTITLTFSAPKALSELAVTIERMSNDPHIMRALSVG